MRQWATCTRAAAGQITRKVGGAAACDAIACLITHTIPTQPPTPTQLIS